MNMGDGKVTGIWNQLWMIVQSRVGATNTGSTAIPDWNRPEFSPLMRTVIRTSKECI